MATSLTIKILTDVSNAVKGIDDVDKKAGGLGQTMGGVAAAIGGAFRCVQDRGLGPGVGRRGHGCERGP